MTVASRGSSSHYVCDYVDVPLRREEAVEQCNPSEMPSCLRHWLGIHGSLCPQSVFSFYVGGPFFSFHLHPQDIFPTSLIVQKIDEIPPKSISNK